jgi:hypothetical protein
MKVTPFEASVATGLLVAGATWLGARINSTTQAKRERKARADERRQVFEQETLVRVQDALDDLYRIVEEAGLERFPPNRDDVQYIDVPPEPLDYRRAEAAVGTLSVRVLDDDLRALVEKVVGACWRGHEGRIEGHLLGPEPGAEGTVHARPPADRGATPTLVQP